MLHLLVYAGLIDLLAEADEVEIGFVGTVLECAVLEVVQFLVVIAPVGVGKLVVVGLTQVQYSAELSVDELCHLNGALYVEIDAGALDDRRQGRIHKTGMIGPVVIAAVAQQDNLVTDIRLLWEEGVVEVVQSVEDFIGLQFHGTGIDRARPSAGDTDVHILIEEHALRRTDVTEVHGPVPVHIVVTGLVLSVAGLAVGAVTVAVDTDLRIPEIPFIADDADDGDGILVIFLDIAARDGRAGQITVLEEAEHKTGGLVDAELTTHLLAVGGGQTTIDGVAQRGTLGNLYLYLQRASEELTALVDHRCRQPFVGEDGCGIRGTRCGVSRPSPIVTAIGLTGPGRMADGLGIGLARDELPLVVTQIDGTAIAVEFEGRLVVLDIIATKPDHPETFCRDGTHVLGHLPQRRVVGIVAEVHTTDIDRLITGVI